MISKFPFINSQTFENEKLKNSSPFGLIFCSEHCPSCKAVLARLDQLSQQFENQIKFYRIIKQNNKYLSDKFEIKSLPTIVFFNNGAELNQRLVGNVSSIEIANVLKTLISNFSIDAPLKSKSCDVLIIGGGPAGLSSAIYTSREGLNTILIEERLPGGKLLETQSISNYPGTNGPIIGESLAKNMIFQAQSFGTEIVSLKSLNKISLKESTKLVVSNDTEYTADSIIIATGAEPRRLPAEGEKNFFGKGIHYCALCDGLLYKNKSILIIGGGNSALKEALFLSRFVSSITIIHQFDQFQASQIVQREILKNKKIKIIFNSEVKKIFDNDNMLGVLLFNTKISTFSEISTDGIFVYIGSTPKTDIFANQISVDDSGYITTLENMQTNIKGIFAAGDVRKKNIRQVATAVSDGVIAALSAHSYLSSI